MWIQIGWLLRKPADLVLHCFKEISRARLLWVFLLFCFLNVFCKYSASQGHTVDIGITERSLTIIYPKYLDIGTNVRVFVRVRVDLSKTERSFIIYSQSI